MQPKRRGPLSEAPSRVGLGLGGLRDVVAQGPQVPPDLLRGLGGPLALSEALELFEESGDAGGLLLGGHGVQLGLGHFFTSGEGVWRGVFPLFQW